MANTMVIGAGVVGAATGQGLLDRGHQVTYVDVNPATIDRLRNEGYTAITPDLVDVNSVDVIFLSVTALTAPDGIDLTHLLAATANLGSKLKHTASGHFPVIVFRCTMPPGTTEDKLIPLLEKHSDKEEGRDFGVVYMPEYLRAVSAKEDFAKPRILVFATGETGNQSHQAMLTLFHDFGAPMHWMSYRAAEFQKYVNNITNAAKISLMNELRRIADELDIDPQEVQRAFEITAQSAENMWNSQYGLRNFGAYGGACLPKDVAAWLLFLDQEGVEFGSPMITATQLVNQQLGGK